NRNGDSMQPPHIPIAFTFQIFRHHASDGYRKSGSRQTENRMVDGVRCSEVTHTHIPDDGIERDFEKGPDHLHQANRNQKDQCSPKKSLPSFFHPPLSPLSGADKRRFSYIYGGEGSDITSFLRLRIVHKINPPAGNV